MYIAFEGCDSAGKTSSCTRIAEWLTDKLPKDIDIIRLHQPGDTAIGEALRHLIKDPSNDMTKLGQFYVMVADHAQFCKEKLKDWLDSGKERDKFIILQDRHSTVSGYVNAVARYNTVTEAEYKSAYNAISQVYPFAIPDIQIVLNLPADQIVKNLQKRGFSQSDRYEAGHDIKDWEKVAQGYKEVITHGIIPTDRYISLDGDKKKTVLISDEIEAILGHKNMVDGPIRDSLRDLYKYMLDEIIEKKIDKNAKREDQMNHTVSNPSGSTGKQVTESSLIKEGNFTSN